MPTPLTRLELAGIETIAREHGLSIIRTDSECIILDDFKVRRHSGEGWVVDGHTRFHSFSSPLLALRYAIQEGIHFLQPVPQEYR